MTDQNGNLLESLVYEPYGQPRDLCLPKIDDLVYTFTDQERDDGTGLYNYNARLYDPVVGMFVTADSVVPSPLDPQLLNRYSYCRNNPLVYVDPSGHSLVAVIVGAVIGAIASGAQSDWDPGAMLAGAVIGGISGGVFSGIESAAHASILQAGYGTTAANIGGGIAGGAAAGATSGGLNAAYYGGDIGQGVFSGAGYGALGGGVFAGVGVAFGNSGSWGQIATQGLAGGALAELQGGDFELGFAFAVGPALAMKGWQKMESFADAILKQGKGVKRWNAYGAEMWDSIGMKMCIGCSDANQNWFTRLFEGQYEGFYEGIDPIFVNRISKVHDTLNAWMYKNGNYIAGGQLYNTFTSAFSLVGMVPAALYTSIAFSTIYYQPIIYK